MDNNTKLNPNIEGAPVSDKSTYKDIVVGLDIGTTKVCVIVSRRGTSGKMDILGIGTAPSNGLSRGVINNVPEAIKSIKAAVLEAETSSGMKIKKAIVGVAGQHINSHPHRNYLTHDTENNEITQQDVDELISQVNRMVLPKGQEIIHVLPQSYKVDNEEGIINPVGMVGTSLQGDFLVITGNANSIKTIGNCVKSAGIEITGLILEPIASSIAVLNDKEKDAGVALIDIGGGTTDLAIFQGGIVRHTAVIPFGGNIITEDIRIGCEVMIEDAEKLKTKHGTALALKIHEQTVIVITDRFGAKDKPHKISKKNLALIIQARMEEIMEEVYHHIEKSGFKNGLLAGIVLSGGGSLLDNTDKITEFMTGIRTRCGSMEMHLMNDSKTRIESPKYATAVGLALMGINLIEKGDLQGDFIEIVPEAEPEVEAETELFGFNENSSKEGVGEFKDDSQESSAGGKGKVGNLFERFIGGMMNRIKEDSPDYDDEV